MAQVETETNARRHLRDLVEGFHSAMLVTRKVDGTLRSRAMAIADNRETHLYFATSLDSGKVEDIAGDPHVNVTLQDGRRFVSLSGDAHVVTDRALIHRLWSESWKVWFPAGKDDPALCLLAVDVREAEYWDQSGTKGLRYLFEAARAYVAGTQPKSGGKEQNAKVHL